MSNRECGACGQCCKLIGVRELEKAPHVWCRYYKRDKGCGIYEARPPGCADFACDWLLDGRLDETWRPDRSGFVLHAGEGGRVINVELDPTQPTAWRRASSSDMRRMRSGIATLSSAVNSGSRWWN